MLRRSRGRVASDLNEPPKRPAEPRLDVAESVLAAGDRSTAIRMAVTVLTADPRNRRAQRFVGRAAASCDLGERQDIARLLPIVGSVVPERPALRQLEALRLALSHDDGTLLDAWLAATARQRDARFIDALLLAHVELSDTPEEERNAARELLPGILRSFSSHAAVVPPRPTAAKGFAPDARPRAMTILDAPSEACFAPHLQLIRPSPVAWRESLERDRPDVLFVESTWMGNGGRWPGALSNEANLAALTELVKACRSQGIPTLFWNKEDPLAFDRFGRLSILFDRVFTTDEALVDRYQSEFGVDVWVLPFAAEPTLYNPINRTPDPSVAPICFAGSWYPGLPGRNEAALPLLKAAMPFGLAIYDRYADQTSGPNRPFPPEFASNVIGSLAPDEVPKAFKRHGIIINVNTITTSPTMCARRAFEAVAVGVPVVSNPCAGMENLLGTLGIRYCPDVATARTAYAEFLAGGEHIERELVAATRHVLSRHTYAHRLQVMLTGICDLPDPEPPEVVIVSATSSQDELDALVGTVLSQAGVRTRTMAIGDDTLDAREAVKIVDVNTFGRLLAGLQRLPVAFIDPRSSYDAHHLLDAVQALRFSGAQVVGKGIGERDTFTSQLALDTLVFDAEVLPTLRAPALTSTAQLAGVLLEDLKRRHGRLYAVHPF
jgi:hypothetical protein